TSATGSAVARRQRISIGEEYCRRTGEARKYGMEPLRAASSTKNENLQHQRNSMITKLASRIKRLESYTESLTMQHIKLYRTAIPDICFATGPCLSRVGSIWRKSISYLERRSGQGF
ncbi:unnamed protein product, partial [Urochloa humidicola]